MGRSGAKSKYFLNQILSLSYSLQEKFQDSRGALISFQVTRLRSTLVTSDLRSRTNTKHFEKKAELCYGLFIENSFHAEFSQNKILTTLFIDGIDSTHKERVGRPSGLTGVSYDNQLWLGPVWKSIIVKPVLPSMLIWVRLGPDIPQSQWKLLK